MDRLVLTLLLAAAPAAAQSVEREDLAVLGWNKGCSVAVNHLGFPARGEAIYDEPVMTRIGTLTIGPGSQAVETYWSADWTGANTWKPDEARKLLTEFVASGYDFRGYVEKLRAEPAAPERPELEETLRSTATLAIRAKLDWPAPPWRLATINYNRTASCVLLIFEHDRRFQYLLTRIYDMKARPERARAHLTNGLLLFNRGDLEGALAETSIAASMYPTGAANRYHHAAMLALTGELDKAIAELREAIKLNPRYREQARTERDFENLRDLPDFNALVSTGSSPKKRLK